MNDETQHKHRKYYILALFAVFIAILGVILPETEFTPKQYINASNITVFGATYTGSLHNISDLNQGYINISEENAQPFYAIINFTNVTNFSFLEAKSKYFSISGTPSTHIVDLEIYCTTDNEYEDLFFLENAAEWRYFTRHFPESMHFIDAQGNVSIKFNHASNGNVNHRLLIDTVRLVTSTQYEQNILYQTINYNTTTGTGGGVSFDGNPVNLNGSNMFNGTISNYSTLAYVNDTFCKLTGCNMTGIINMGRNPIHNVSGINEDLGSREIVVNASRNSLHTNEIIRYYNDTQNISIDNSNVDFLVENEDVTQNLIVYSNIHTSGWNFFYAQRARGTNNANGTAYIAPLQSGDNILGLNVRGYAGGTGWTGSTGSLTFSTSGNWNTTYTPTKLDISWLYPNASTSVLRNIRFEDSALYPMGVDLIAQNINIGTTSAPFNHTYTKNITASGLAMAGSGNYSILIADSTGRIIAVPMNGNGNHYGCWNSSGYPYPGNPGC